MSDSEQGRTPGVEEKPVQAPVMENEYRESGAEALPGREGSMNQQAFPPDYNPDDEMDLDDYEIVSAEFFAQVKEPAFTVNVNKVTPNAASVRLLSHADYVKIMVRQDEKKLVLKPTDEYDLNGYKWVRVKDGKRYPSQRTGEPFVLFLCEVMNWNPDYRYKILGKRMFSKGVAILVFDLTVAQPFPKGTPGVDGKPERRSGLLEGWNGSFGPRYGDNQRSLQVDTFEGYTVFSIRGNKKNKQKTAAQPQNDSGDSGIEPETDNHAGPETSTPAEPMTPEQNEPINGEEASVEVNTPIPGGNGAHSDASDGGI